MTGPLVHDALIYSSDEELVSVLTPFLGEAIAAGEPAIAVMGPAKIGLLRDALGRRADDLSCLDATEFYRRPVRALTAYGALLDDLLRADSERIRIVGEIQFGATEEEHVHWSRYEAILNRGLAGRRAWIVCPYDVRALPDGVVAEAYRTHPFVWTGGQRAPNGRYRQLGEMHAHGGGEPGGNELLQALVVDEPSAAAARRSVAGAARAGGLADELVDDLVFVVNDLQRNILEGGGQASVRILRDRARWICEVRGPSIDGSGGVWTARLLTDDVDVEPGAVRLTFESGAGDVRGRILDAASELFYRDGVRATGITPIIANAGVAKASFYHHFPSKDDLVVAWLQQRSRRRLDRFAEAEQAARSPDERLLVLFDVLGDWFAEEDFRGFGPLNAVVELPENENVKQAFQEVLLEVRERLGHAAAAAGFVAPADLVEELLLLGLGATVMAVGRAQPDSAKIARRAAARLLATTTRA
jgi:AcrR family transcriptional regulator